jgi:hypothetical protein
MPEPAKPVLPVPAAEVPPLPVPAPVVPPGGLNVPPPADLAPPTPPAGSPEPAPIALPAKPESDLPGGNRGTNVKPDVPANAPAPVLTPPAPVLPVPEPAKPAGPPATPDRNAPPAAGGPTSPTIPAPGDDPVSAFSQSAAAALLGGALLTPATPAPAAPPAPLAVPAAQKSDEKPDAEAVKKQLDETNKKLDEIQKQLAQLTEALNGRKDSEGYRITGSGLVEQVRDLRDRLAAVEDDLRKMKASSSLRPPGPATIDPKANTGVVRVVNEYPVRISIVVNGTSYRVEPSKSLDIDVPAGEFSYQLLESGAATTKSTIKEKETVTLRIK